MGGSSDKFDFVDEQFTSITRECFGGPMSLAWLSSVSAYMFEAMATTMELMDQGDERVRGKSFDRCERSHKNDPLTITRN